MKGVITTAALIVLIATAAAAETEPTRTPPCSPWRRT